jgi:DNA-binding CsgD family transcriptional regulator
MRAFTDGGSARDRLLSEAFLRQRRRTRGALVLVDERLLLTNAVAARSFTTTDRAALWDRALQAVEAGLVEPIAYTTRDGTSLRGAVQPAYDHDVMIAALVKFGAPNGHTTRTKRPSIGWESLTDSELTLTQLVAEGVTNREAAARLYVSHHTVDSHLRQIFQELGINSRVQLARIAGSTLIDPTAESA